MGLDMWLTIKPKSEDDFNDVAYWRKANQIHQWFVNNCANGDLDSTLNFVDVSFDDLRNLKQVCQDVIANSNLISGEVNNGYRFENGNKVSIKEPGKYIEDSSYAKQNLPTMQGFFYGSTDYDQWYFRQLESTIEQIDNILSDESLQDVQLSYVASW